MRRAAPLALVALLVLAAPAARAAAPPPVSFAGPSYVDYQLAGGEPLVIADPIHHTLVYTSHEGTTHLYRNGIVASFNFGTSYRNQVNVWVSRDGGGTWARTSTTAGFTSPPAQNQGFSDPDLTQDEGGRIYNTGIDLANDALFSTGDGGFTWDRGTAQCHDGDRPWLAGGKANEAFMGTNTVEGTLSHQIFQTTDGGNTCSSSGIPDAGTTPDGESYSGNGKIFYDHARGKLIEPVSYSKGGASTGIGVATWSRGDSAFTPHKAIDTSVYAHWPSMAIDGGGNVYVVWDTDPRDPSAPGGCSGPGPVPNQVNMIMSSDFGNTWSPPMTVATPSNARVFWPWVVAGDRGKVSVVWYQTDQVADLDCGTPANVRVYAWEASIFNADDPATRTMQAQDVVGRPIHNNGVCQGGTTCVATGQDRRLGDFFTNALDNQGCVVVATGDTTQKDPVTGSQYPISLPMFIRQDGGPNLTGGFCRKTPGEDANGPTGSASAAGCLDRKAPRSRAFRKRIKATRTRIRISGRSKDRGCRNPVSRYAVKGKVRRVGVAVGLTLPGKKCRFILPKKGHPFGKPRSCLRTTYLPAKGRERWRITIKGNFPPGRYKVWIRGRDYHRNIEKKSKAHNLSRFSIK